MTNSDIVERLEEAMQLMEMLDMNVFKINTFRNAAQQIEKMGTQLQQMSSEERASVLTKTMLANVEAMLTTETFPELEEMEKQIPQGVRNLLLINGIGPKKVKTLWKDAGIANIGSLKEACQQGQVSQLKGFGAKIQEVILQGIVFLEGIEGKMLMHKGEILSQAILSTLKSAGIEGAVEVGDLVMKSEVVSALEYLVPMDQFEALKSFLSTSPDFDLQLKQSSPFQLSALRKDKGILCRFFFSGRDTWVKDQYMLNTTDAHWQNAAGAGVPMYKTWLSEPYDSEAVLFEKLGKTMPPPDLRVGIWEWEDTAAQTFSDLVKYEDLKGCIHNHSTYSDGRNTLLEMAQWCRQNGMEYFGIADHSQTAIYANGLYEEKVERQWAEINRLNAELAPFQILKGIESDILPDGSLDYPDAILAGFDYVVASVHSNLRMDIDTATQRLLKAIENPYTTVLGHCSGRILLKRPGYPLHYQKIIDACIANGVVIEVNAHPARLDMDWKNLRYAVQKGALISINPDAHFMEDMAMMKYGVWMARKAGAPRQQVLNAMTLSEVQSFLQSKKAGRK